MGHLPGPRGELDPHLDLRVKHSVGGSGRVPVETRDPCLPRSPELKGRDSPPYTTRDPSVVGEIGTCL